MFHKIHKSIISRLVLAVALLFGVLGTVQAAPSVDFVLTKGIGADRISDIALDEGRNIYIAGDFYGITDFDPGAGISNLTPQGSRDIYVSKLDSQGNFLWAIKMGGTDTDFSLAMDLDSNGNIYTTGHFTATADFDPGSETYDLSSNGQNDIFVGKLDNDGNFIWAKSMGGLFGDLGNAMALDANDNVYLTGFFSDTVDFNPSIGSYDLSSSGNYDIFVCKLDVNGNFLWAKSIGGISEDLGRDMVLDADGNIYLTGIFSGTVDFDPGIGTYDLTSAGSRQQYIAKLDGDGNFLWAKNISSSYDHVSINVDGKGNVYTTGEFTGIVDFDPGPGTAILTSTGPNDVFIIKLDSAGNFVWARNFGGSINFEYSEDIALDNSGNIYTTGMYSGTADFDPGPGTYNLTSQGLAPASDIFISKLNSRGNFVWAKSMGGTNADSGFAITLHGGDIFTAGTFEGTADLDPGPGTSYLSSTGGYDVFVNNIHETVIRYVKWDATGANNGTSWTDAYTDLQSALADVNSGDEIWVAAGTYKPTAGIDRTVSFTLKNGVAIYGGFAGVETLRTERDPSTNVTILSGNIGAVSNTSDNSYHVVVGGSNTDNSAVLDGFTVTGGNADGSAPNDRGGGMYNSVGSPNLNNIKLNANSAIAFGGGIYNENSNPILTDVTIQNNTAVNGGGMSNVSSNPILQNVVFNNNSVTAYDNAYGGGMENQSSNPILTNVSFISNSAKQGGGMSNYLSSPTLYKVNFSTNTANSGGGMYNWQSSNPAITNVTFNGNSATGSGGGIFNTFNSYPTLTNVTLSGNSASFQGGGIYNGSNSSATVRNSILYVNYGGQIYNNNIAAVVNYSIVQGGYAGTGNLDAEPLLGPLQDNGGFTPTMALLPGSPAIDTGDDANCPATDQRGVTRPFGSHCDIGAYEFDKATIEVTIGEDLKGSYFLASGEEKRVSYSASGGPVKVESTNGVDLVAAVRLQALSGGVLRDYNESIGIPASALSYKYYFPVYENLWAPLNSQIRFAHLNPSATQIKVTIGTEVVFNESVPANTEKRLSFAKSGGPVVIESVDGVTKVLAAIRLQCMNSGTLNCYSETPGLPVEALSAKYYFPVYENLWAPLNSQLRFSHLSPSATQLRVTIGGEVLFDEEVPANTEKRLSFPKSGGPVIVESVDGVTQVIAAIRLQAMSGGVLRDYNESMGTPANALSHKYYFPVYENLWAPLNSQIRFAHLSPSATQIRVTIGSEVVFDESVPANTEKRLSFPKSGGPVIIESVDGVTQVIAAIRLQCMNSGVLNCYSETPGLPVEALDTLYYFPVYENLWVHLNSQLRFSVP